ncbi:hypothetical protein NEUTE1DRAFT_53322 [Neurospora tetrasperma FGSC 2508]|uniref:Lytic polysaccharide monooxygenase n=1 Tax=Neurospora tetrasperma (strain FGSC 2508 / ATCC MYA-4615 / P0657) TaxID=510951 RepID=F8MZR0_NEUT8|nr:uncharacterized protein NEUTE1DRAFT_53322 [Neurospora tetrasperma FGSC 2508]EGO52047.1 hypothetical protein NEUTE1DRAFT_53322 [Neurospora tetrasperma FGSC 2508]
MVHVNKFSTSTATAALLLFTSVQGHMVMRTPPSYNLYKGDTLLQVDPLDGVKYLYPCQNRYEAGNATTLKAGDVQLVQFTGGAQHGGGSCQFSVSYDDPEKSNGSWSTSATFKTIYTIIGGCPAEFHDEANNLPTEGRPKDAQQRLNTDFCNNDSGVDCTREFLIPIPDFLPQGKATFAWTWFNKLGQREMYMNCAPVEITGGQPSPEKYESLPNIFIANIPKQKGIPGYDGCVTGGGAANVVNIPNPGKYGRIINQLKRPFSKPDPAPAGYNLGPKIDNDTLPVFEDNPKTISKGGAAPTGGEEEVNAGTTSASVTVTGTVNQPAVTTTTTTTSASAAAGTETAVAPISSASASGTFITAPSDELASTATASATGAAESDSGGGKCDDANATETGAGDGEKTTIEVTKTMTVKVTVTANVPSGTSASASAGSGSGGDEGGSGEQKKQCEKDQVAVCFGDDFFGLCANGWAVPQKVSPGTRCENGSLVYSAVQREGGKRAESYAAGEGHARRHLKRRSGRPL